MTGTYNTTVAEEPQYAHTRHGTPQVALDELFSRMKRKGITARLGISMLYNAYAVFGSDNE